MLKKFLTGLLIILFCVGGTIARAADCPTDHSKVPFYLSVSESAAKYMTKMKTNGYTAIGIYEDTIGYAVIWFKKTDTPSQHGAIAIHWEQKRYVVITCERALQLYKQCVSSGYCPTASIE